MSASIPRNHSLETTSLPTNQRLQWLDALRGWAVLAVVLVHSGQIAHSGGGLGKFAACGQYGVQLFFVVSSITISITYETHLQRFGGGMWSQLAWLLKRYFRIAPLYYLAVAIYAFITFLVSSRPVPYGGANSAAGIILNLLFLHSWIPSAINSVVPGGWSIGVEMLFYLAVPLIWTVRSPRRRIVWLMMAGFLCLSLSLLSTKLWKDSFFDQSGGFLYYWFPCQAPVFMCGLIYYIMAGVKIITPRPPVGNRWKSMALLVPTILLVAANVFQLFVLPRALYPLLFALAFLICIPCLHGPAKPILVNELVIFVGKVSYSIYIFHFGVLDVIDLFIMKDLQIVAFNGLSALIFVFFLTVVVSTAIGLISKRIIEDCGIKLGHKLSQSLLTKFGVRDTRLETVAVIPS